MRRTPLPLFAATLLSVAFASLQQNDQADKKSPIADVTLKAGSFNPSLQETVTLDYSLVQPSKVTVRVYDPDGGLVVTLLDSAEQQPGAHQLEWNGKDVQARVVPDEAYTFVIETSSGAVHDPATFSGGEVGDITTAQFDRGAGTVVYSLPAPARVLIRFGIQSGPLLKTLVDWKPRIAGSITEYWDGRDEDKIIQLRDQKGFTALITYVTLPEATVIAYGNSEESYRDYKLGRAKDRPAKPKRPRLPDPELRLRPDGLVPPAWARAPHVQMSFPRFGTGSKSVPQVHEAVDVRVDVDSSDKDRLLQDQFEIIFYVDNVFFAEAERGYLPFNWRWELNQLPEGEHTLTANIASFRGQVGVASRKVHLVKSEP